MSTGIDFQSSVKPHLRAQIDFVSKTKPQSRPVSARQPNAQAKRDPIVDPTMIPGLARPPPIPAPPTASSGGANRQPAAVNPDDDLAALARALESAEQSGV